MLSTISMERWNTKIIIIISFLVSIILIISPLFISEKYSDIKNIPISVGCSIIASNIIMLLSSAYMLRSKRRIEIIDKWGMESIYKTRAEMNTSANKSLLHCKKNIEIIAFGLKSLREAKGNEIEELLKNKVIIKIITLNPCSEILPLVDKKENLLDGATKKSIEDLINWVSCLKKKSPKYKIEIKLYDYLPLDFYFKVDDTIYVGPYLKGLSSQQTISYEFTAGEGYKYWSEYFSQIWESC